MFTTEYNDYTPIEEKKLNPNKATRYRRNDRSAWVSFPPNMSRASMNRFMLMGTYSQIQYEDGHVTFH